MKKYELFLVLPGTLDENESEAKMGEVLAIVDEFGSESNVKSMGKNRLAFPIKNVRYGYFYSIVFQSEPQNIKIIEDKIKLFRGLLRAVLSNYNNAMEGAENNKFFSDENKNNYNEDIGVEKRFDDSLTEKEDVNEDTNVADETVEEETIVKENKVVAPEKENVEDSKPKSEEMDLKEIDKKLDEILSDDSINI